jgi:head-tail adaptor
MKARNRPHLIVIERRTAKTDGRGQPTKDIAWSEFAREYAAIFYGAGREQREAAQQAASQAASFEVLSNSRTRAVTPGDEFRLRYAGAIWDIRSVAEIGLNAGVKLNAVKIAA